MRAIVHYLEGAVSAFTLFPQYKPVLRTLPKRKQLTLQEAMAKDAEVLRQDFRNAMELVCAER